MNMENVHTLCSHSGDKTQTGLNSPTFSLKCVLLPCFKQGNCSKCAEKETWLNTAQGFRHPLISTEIIFFISPLHYSCDLQQQHNWQYKVSSSWLLAGSALCVRLQAARVSIQQQHRLQPSVGQQHLVYAECNRIIMGCPHVSQVCQSQQEPSAWGKEPSPDWASGKRKQSNISCLHGRKLEAKSH